MLKTLSLILCPVIATGVAVKTVPSVKKAVHKATAPRVVAKRAPPAPPPCIIPISLEPLRIDVAPKTTALLDFGALSPAKPLEVASAVPPIIIPTSSTPLPEPATWIAMVAGFGAVGGVMRQRRPLHA